MALDHILSPITINRLEIKNRIARASHGTSYGRGAVTEHVAFYPPVPDGPEDLTNAR